MTDPAGAGRRERRSSVRSVAVRAPRRSLRELPPAEQPIAARLRPTVIAIALGAAFAPGAQAGEGTPAASASEAVVVGQAGAPPRAAVLAQAGGSSPGAAEAAAARPGSEPAALEEVVVTATRSPAQALGVPASVTVVRSEDLAKREVAALRGRRRRGSRPVRPGAGARRAGAGQRPGGAVAARSPARTPRTLVMIDGQPINNALSGGVNVAGIPIESVERVEVVRGPYSASYGGNAMGGVVNFITAGPDDPLTELRARTGQPGPARRLGGPPQALRGRAGHHALARLPRGEGDPGQRLRGQDRHGAGAGATGDRCRPHRDHGRRACVVGGHEGRAALDAGEHATWRSTIRRPRGRSSSLESAGTSTRSATRDPTASWATPAATACSRGSSRRRRAQRIALAESDFLTVSPSARAGLQGVRARRASFRRRRRRCAPTSAPSSTISTSRWRGPAPPTRRGRGS